MGDTDSIIKVRMADFAVCQAPDKITTIGLGSCVGLVIYDPVSRVCGLLHAMLPDSSKIRNHANRAKFVDTGFDDMLQELLRKGGRQERLTAKLAGGAQMFDFSGESEITSIGRQNVEAVKAQLKKHGILLLAEDTGKNYGRTIVFDPQNGELEIRAVGHPLIKI